VWRNTRSGNTEENLRNYPVLRQRIEKFRSRSALGEEQGTPSKTQRARGGGVLIELSPKARKGDDDLTYFSLCLGLRWRGGTGGNSILCVSSRSGIRLGDVVLPLHNSSVGGVVRRVEASGVDQNRGAVAIGAPGKEYPR